MSHLPLSFLQRWSQLCAVCFIRPQFELDQVFLSSQLEDICLKSLFLCLYKSPFLISPTVIPLNVENTACASAIQYVWCCVGLGLSVRGEEMGWPGAGWPGAAVLAAFLQLFGTLAVVLWSIAVLDPPFLRHSTSVSSQTAGMCRLPSPQNSPVVT